MTKKTYFHIFILALSCYIVYTLAYLRWTYYDAVMEASGLNNTQFGMVLPSLFSGAWMAIFSGTSMYYELHGGGITDAYLAGYENTAYAVFEKLPATFPIVVIFLPLRPLRKICLSGMTKKEIII